MKLAIAISGPPRNIIQLLPRIVRDLKNGGINCGVFVHLWRVDSGTKVREKSSLVEGSLVDEILSYEYVKAVTFETPFQDGDYQGFPRDLLEEGQSNEAAVMGMFIGVNRLISEIILNPHVFTHILRLRSDCLLLNTDFFSALFSLDLNNIYVSKNYSIPHAWISDHIMLAPLERFAKIWEIENFISFFHAYRKAGANPERYLSARMKELNYSEVNELWFRYKDYHILYDNPRGADPLWVSKITVDNVADVFLYPNKYIDQQDRVEISSLLEKQKANQDYYAKPKSIKAFIRLNKMLTKFFGKSKKE